MESFLDTEIAVLGAGPAGSTFVRLAGQRHDITLIDRRDMTGMKPARGKCCGGLLSPDAQRSLAAQGLTLPLKLLVDPQIFAVRTLDLNLPGQRLYPRSYVNLDREKFDRWLVSLIPETVRLLDRTLCVKIERDPQGRFLLHMKRPNGETIILRARWLVGADGGGSLVRRTFFPERPIRQYVAIQEHYEGGELSPFYGALFDRELTDCYGWLISKGRRLMLGGAFPQIQASTRFQTLRQKLELRGYRFGALLKREGCLVSRPAGPGEFCTGSGQILLLGDAAGFVSPSSLQGISYALDSGAILADLIGQEAGDTADRYRRATAPLRRQLMGKLLKTPFMYQPQLRSLILRSGILSLPESDGTAAQPADSV
jgi:flavin-dependent dehydrogenase